MLFSSSLSSTVVVVEAPPALSPDGASESVRAEDALDRDSAFLEWLSEAETALNEKGVEDEEASSHDLPHHIPELDYERDNDCHDFPASQTLLWKTHGLGNLFPLDPVHLLHFFSRVFIRLRKASVHPRRIGTELDSTNGSDTRPVLRVRVATNLVSVAQESSTSRWDEFEAGRRQTRSSRGIRKLNIYGEEMRRYCRRESHVFERQRTRQRSIPLSIRFSFDMVKWKKVKRTGEAMVRLGVREVLPVRPPVSRVETETLFLCAVEFETQWHRSDSDPRDFVVLSVPYLLQDRFRSRSDLDLRLMTRFRISNVKTRGVHQMRVRVDVSAFGYAEASTSFLWAPRILDSCAVFRSRFHSVVPHVDEHEFFRFQLPYLDLLSTTMQIRRFLIAVKKLLGRNSDLKKQCKDYLLLEAERNAAFAAPRSRHRDREIDEIRTIAGESEFKIGRLHGLLQSKDPTLAYEVFDRGLDKRVFDVVTGENRPKHKLQAAQILALLLSINPTGRTRPERLYSYVNGVLDCLRVVSDQLAAVCRLAKTKKNLLCRKQALTLTRSMARVVKALFLAPRKWLTQQLAVSFSRIFVDLISLCLSQTSSSRRGSKYSRDFVSLCDVSYETVAVIPSHVVSSSWTVNVFEIVVQTLSSSLGAMERQCLACLEKLYLRSSDSFQKTVLKRFRMLSQLTTTVVQTSDHHAILIAVRVIADFLNSIDQRSDDQLPSLFRLIPVLSRAIRSIPKRFHSQMILDSARICARAVILLQKRSARLFPRALLLDLTEILSAQWPSVDLTLVTHSEAQNWVYAFLARFLQHAPTRSLGSLVQDQSLSGFVPPLPSSETVLDEAISTITWLETFWLAAVNLSGFLRLSRVIMAYCKALSETIMVEWDVDEDSLAVLVAFQLKVAEKVEFCERRRARTRSVDS